MISFVWSSKYPLQAGKGGSENYTVGHIRELTRLGIPSRVITIGHGEEDGRKDFPDVRFKALKSKEELASLADTIVYVTYPLNVKTIKRSYAILHCPPITMGQRDPLFDKRGARLSTLIAPSKFAAKLWANDLKILSVKMPIVSPFAESVFSSVRRPIRKDGLKRILFAGRLTANKGIYTLLAALHMPEMDTFDYRITVTTADNMTDEGRIIEGLLRAHPKIDVIPAQTSSIAVAELMAAHDIVTMPSSNLFWKEIFGIVSVEAQHAGCRVVASNCGGLPETNCGGLLLAEADNPKSLAVSLQRAAILGPLSVAERQFATSRYTIKESLQKLIKTIKVGEPTLLENLLSSKHGRLIGQQLQLGMKSMGQLGIGVTGDQKLR